MKTIFCILLDQHGCMFVPTSLASWKSCVTVSSFCGSQNILPHALAVYHLSALAREVNDNYFQLRSLLKLEEKG